MDNMIYSFLRNKLLNSRPYLKKIDQGKRILEIGPLTTPMVKKSDDVFYADIRSTDEIKQFYRGHPIDEDQICEVDYVVKDTYAEAFDGVEKFDYVLASHVIEHIPKIIHFFHDIATIMNKDALLCLTIPDKRYCFDHFRVCTSFAEAYNVYANNVEMNPSRVLEYNLFALGINDAEFFWGENEFEKFLAQAGPVDSAMAEYERAAVGENVNAHYSVFTPETFLLLLYGMTKVSLLPFKCIEFYPTQPGAFEFSVVLQMEPDLLIESSSQKQKEMDRLVGHLRLNVRQERSFRSIKSRAKNGLIRVLRKIKRTYEGKFS
jgi:hypothetical protein